jgi:hypothetical protein
LPKTGFPQAARATEAHLFKFGEQHFLRMALRSGEVRIRAASSLDGDHLTMAQRDGEEGQRWMFPSPHGKPIILSRDAGTILDTSKAGKRRIALSMGGDRDFFVWSCSTEYEPRMYLDFGADACLVCYDLPELGRRLNAGMAKAMPTLPGMVGSEVLYCDPLVPDEWFEEAFRKKLPLETSKHFKYAYQWEYRFVWPTKVKRLPTHLDIEIQPLHDICDLIGIGDKDWLS